MKIDLTVRKIGMLKDDGDRCVYVEFQLTDKNLPHGLVIRADNEEDIKFFVDNLGKEIELEVKEKGE